MPSLKPVCNLLCAIALAISPILHAAPPGTPDVRFKVYSQTAVELFWETPSSNSLVVGYEVSRDGELLGLFDALSYFDSTLQTGTEYTYTVRAIDFNGEESDLASVSLTTRVPETAEDRIAELEQEIADLKEQLGSSIPAPVPETGQTESFFEGDDGDWQAGVAIPNPRFIANVNTENDQNENEVCDNDEVCNGSVTDRLTGLVWLQNAGCFGRLEFSDAIASANTLVGDNSSNCQLNDGSQAGEWRLPNIRELLSIVDFSKNALDRDQVVSPGTPFTGIVGFEESGFPDSYWSSTATGPNGAYTASMSVGWVNREILSLLNNVWPVRN